MTDGGTTFFLAKIYWETVLHGGLINIQIMKIQFFSNLNTVNLKVFPITWNTQLKINH